MTICIEIGDTNYPPKIQILCSAWMVMSSLYPLVHQSGLTQFNLLIILIWKRNLTSTLIIVDTIQICILAFQKRGAPTKNTAIYDPNFGYDTCRDSKIHRYTRVNKLIWSSYDCSFPLRTIHLMHVLGKWCTRYLFYKSCKILWVMLDCLSFLP